MHGLERGTNDAEQRLASDVKQTKDVKPPKEIGISESDITSPPKEIGGNENITDCPKELSSEESHIHTRHESLGLQIDNQNPIESNHPIEYVPCRNETLAGDIHPITGVPFHRKEVEVNGRLREVVVPEFKSIKDVQLPERRYQGTDKEQFAYCNEQLKKAIEDDPALCKLFDKEQQLQIRDGETPDGFVWHHNEETGKMQLVDFETHQKTGHTGGRSLWGGGSDNR